MKMENGRLTGSAANSLIHSWQFRIPSKNKLCHNKQCFNPTKFFL